MIKTHTYICGLILGFYNPDQVDVSLIIVYH